LVALAAKLFRISHKHRLNRRSPSPQAQTVKTALRAGLKNLNRTIGGVSA